MEHRLPELPYPMNALEPHISAETLEYHYGKHHQTYVDTLNDLVRGTPFQETPLEELIKTAQGEIFNNAAQVWNHTLYWHCLSPQGGGRPEGDLAGAINRKWGNFSAFKDAFTHMALHTFGSGWVWLVKTREGVVDLLSTGNAGNPLTTPNKALLTCDVWEHAYYIDYRNKRPEYLEAFWKLVDWKFAGRNYAQ